MYGASGTFDEELSSSVALEASVTSLSSAPGCSHAKNTQTMHYDKTIITIKRDNHHLSAISCHTFFSKSVKPASAAAASFLSSWLKVWKLLLKFSFCLFKLLAQRSMSFAIWHTNILFGCPRVYMIFLSPAVLTSKQVFSVYSSTLKTSMQI